MVLIRSIDVFFAAAIVVKPPCIDGMCFPYSGVWGDQNLRFRLGDVIKPDSWNREPSWVIPTEKRALRFALIQAWFFGKCSLINNNVSATDGRGGVG